MKVKLTEAPKSNRIDRLRAHKWFTMQVALMYGCYCLKVSTKDRQYTELFACKIDGRHEQAEKPYDEKAIRRLIDDADRTAASPAT